MSLPLEILCSGIESWVGLVLLDIFFNRLATDFWNREYILWCIMTGGGRDFHKVFPISSQHSTPTVYDVWSKTLVLTNDFRFCSPLLLYSAWLLPSPLVGVAGALLCHSFCQKTPYSPFCFNICFRDCCMVCKLSLWDFDHFWDGSSYLSSRDQLCRCLS